MFKSILFLLPLVSANWFMHVSDVHFDDSYKIGSPANCEIGDWLGTHCCREYSIPKKPERAASKWGDFNCDTPFDLMNKSFTWMADMDPTPDFVIYTGDSPGHHDLTQSIKKNLLAIQAVTEQMFRFKQVYCNLGNHAPWPVDQLGAQPLSEYLTKRASQLWTQWLPNDATEQLKDSGFYAVKITPTVKLISLNTLWFDKHNLLINHKTVNTGNQWSWLVNELNSSRSANETVWLIGHVFPGSAESMSIYTKEMVQLVAEYNSTIRYQFWGHSHDDWHFVYPNNTGVGWITASLMPDKHYPSFRMFEYDPKTMTILDYQQYVLNLTQTIETDQFQFQLEYSAKKLYGLADMERWSWNELIWRMERNITLFNLYYKNYKTGYDVSDCALSCKKDFLQTLRLT